MIRARFRMTLPEGLWITAVSEAHPDATFRLLTGVPLDDRSLELGEVRAADPETVVDALASHDQVVACDRLHVDGERALVRYETTEQALFAFLGDASLPPQFPLSVQDGRMTFDVTATRDQFEALGDALDASGFRYELLSVVAADSRTDVLTDRQRECLEVAVRRGYFAVPRETELSAVADELGIDTSTASETLRRATERVVDWFLVGAESDEAATRW